MNSNDKVKKQTVFKEDNEPGKEKETKEKKSTSSGLDENVAGLLCYIVGFFSGIIFLFIEKDNRFVRFHAIQSIILWVILFAISLIITTVPIIGWIVALLLPLLYVILWVFMMYKAYQGEYYKLPFIGDIAEKEADKVRVDREI